MMSDLPQNVSVSLYSRFPYSFLSMKTALFLLTLLGLVPRSASAAGKELEGERAAAQTVCPSPEEARAKMTVPPGYEVRCFAHEPMVQNPVAMTWDHRGRLWVVELYEYPEGTPLPVEKRPFGGEATNSDYHAVPEKCKAKDNPLEHEHDSHPNIPRDRVIILEDTDNDGMADKRTVFVEGLNLASAILCGDGGIYVGQQPHLLQFKDTDGDDHADEWRVVLTGFGREDTHELLNSFCWGPDGWLYMTHGVFTNSKVRRPGETEDKGFKFDAGIGRCKPFTGEFEVFADGTSNPWGCDYDARGNFFVSACVIDHFFHMAPGGIYQRQGGAPENPYAYELLPSIVTHKHFRAAYAGVQIYQGGRYPEDTWGHAFIGNIHDNAIHEEVLTPVGATFKCEPRRDFLRANDGWFRPVSTQTGPDGFLWVMDWCDKYPCYQNAKANPEGVDRERGRIWRIVVPASAGKGGPPAGGTTMPSRESRDMDLKKLSTPELVKLLEHPNNWMRRTARRMLVENKDATAETPLMNLLTSTSHPGTRAEVFWTLTWLGGARKLLDADGLNAPEATIKTWQARLIGERLAEFQRSIQQQVNWPYDERLPEHMGIKLEMLAADHDPSVQFAVATAMVMADTGYLTVNRAGKWERYASAYINGQPTLENLLKSAASMETGVLPFAIWRALEPQIVRRQEDMNTRHKDEWLVWFAGVAPTAQPLSRVLTYKSMRRLCDTRNAKNLDLAIAFCEKVQAHDILLAHALDGLLKGQEGGVLKPTVDVSKQLATWRASNNADVRKHAQNLAVLWGDNEAITELLAVASSATAAQDARLQALQTLRKVKSDTVRDGLVRLLSSTSPQAPPVIIEAIRAAADIGGDALPPVLITLAASKDFGIQQAALAALAGRADWAHAMLDAITAGKVSATGFPVSVRRSLATSQDKAIRDHAFKVLGAWKEASDDVKALIAAKRKACLEGEPDLVMGKMVFTTTCAVCHTFHGGGQKVGPELIGSGRSNLDALLANMIDPNQIIGNGYEAINVITKDNRTVSGRMVEDTPSHVKLLAIGGAEQIVPRDQIAKLENTRQSLMPMGFGALPDDVFRNLIWYVLAPPEEGPLTKEKKAALSTNMDAAPAKKPSGNSTRAIDWESVSLWNPNWKVSAPDFERTPMKLPEFHGRTNVLLMHPFAKDKPCSLERTVKLEAGKPHKLSVTVAAHDQGDWELRVKVNGQEVKKSTVGHDGERWKTVAVDLSEHAGKEVTLRIEGAATGWSWEFGYWGEVKVE